MKVIIYLYRRHDMDLVTLYKNPNFGFRKVLIKAIYSYATGHPYIISAPATYNAADKNFKSRYRIELNFDEQKDSDIITWLKTIKPNYRCITLKCIMRGHIVGPIVYGCTNDTSDSNNATTIYAKIKQALPMLYDAPLKTKVQEKQLLKAKSKQMSNLTSESYPNKNKNNIQPINNVENNIETELLQHKDEILKFIQNLAKSTNDNNSDVTNNVPNEHIDNKEYIDKTKSNFDKSLSINKSEKSKLSKKQNITSESHNSNLENNSSSIDFDGFGDINFDGFGDNDLDSNAETSEDNSNINSENDFDLFNDINTLINQF